MADEYKVMIGPTVTRQGSFRTPQGRLAQRIRDITALSRLEIEREWERRFAKELLDEG